MLKYIKQATSAPNSNGIPIYVDPKGLKDAEATLQSPIRLDLEGVPLKTTLRLMLKQIGLAYCVRDENFSSSALYFQGINEESVPQSELEGNDPRGAGPGGFEHRRALGRAAGVAAFRHGQLDHEGRSVAEA